MTTREGFFFPPFPSLREVKRNGGTGARGGQSDIAANKEHCRQGVCGEEREKERERGRDKEV